MDAFDTDVLVFATDPHNALGRRVRALLPDDAGDVGERPAGVGSVLLLPEALSKPTRDEADDELMTLSALLARLDLRPVDEATARLATVLGAKYHLHAADAVHLATAVNAAADRFITNNQRDFPKAITEVDVTYPDDLPDPDESEATTPPPDATPPPRPHESA